VLLEELGAVAAPLPFLEPGVLAPAILGMLGRYDEYSAAIESGALIVVPALKEPGASWFAAPSSAARVARSAWGEPRSGSASISGVKDFVSWAGPAHSLLWPARADSYHAGDEAISWSLIPADDPGLELEAMETSAEEQVFRASARDVAPQAMLGGSAGLLDKVLAVAAVAQAAEITGLCRTLMERTVEYAKDRVQFGVPIGSFQAVQHRCVEMATDVEGMRLLTRQAAWLLDAGLSAQPQASLAKAFASEGARRCIYNAHQVHGAVGFIREHDLYLFTSRLRVLEARYGDAAFHRALAAKAFVAYALGPVAAGEPCRV
jgi:alkylation response protein AidB-like acyl-CoA dehydrogenase